MQQHTFDASKHEQLYIAADLYNLKDLHCFAYAYINYQLS